MPKSSRKFQRTRARNNHDPSSEKSDEISPLRPEGEIAALKLVKNIYEFFLDNAGNCDCNFDSKAFSVDKNPDDDSKTDPKDWDFYVVAFKYKGERYKIFFAFEFRPNAATIQQRMPETFPENNIFSELAEFATNFWIQFEKTKYFIPFVGGAKSNYLVLFDAWPHHEKISLFPHHKHAYQVDRNKKGPAKDFLGSIDDLVEDLVSRIPIID